MFNININRLVLWQLPERWRKVKFVAWLTSLMQPLNTLYNTFMDNRADNLYRLNHDSCVFSLENAINDRFDIIERRIFITDGLTKDRIYIFTEAELKPVYLDVIPLFNNEDYADTGVDFIVWLPSDLIFPNQDKITMTALINSYKLPSKRFRIYKNG